MLRTSHRITSLSEDSALRRRRGVLPGAVLLAALALLMISFQAGAAPVSAAAGSLRVDPAAQTVAAGQSFTVTITQSADVTTLSAQTNLRFNPAVVQMTTMQPGGAYAAALFLYGIEQDGSAASVEAAIAAANRTGVLRNLATFFAFGTGSVPPGDTTFVSIGMKGKAGGKTALELVPLEFTCPDPVTGTPLSCDSPVEMLDGEANSIPVTTRNGEVTVTGGAAPPPGATPVAAEASATPEPSPTPDPAVLAAKANASATLSISSNGASLAVGEEAQIELKIKTNVNAMGAQADITFDNAVIEVTKLEPGKDWSQGKVSVGTGRQTVEQALADGNDTGELKAVGVSLLPATGNTSADASGTPTPSASAASPAAAVPAEAGGHAIVFQAQATGTPSATPASPPPSRTPSPAPAKETTFMVLSVKGLKDGETELKLNNALVRDEDGDAVKVTVQGGTVTVGSSGGGGFSFVWLIAIVVLVAAVAAGGAFAYRSMKGRSDF